MAKLYIRYREGIWINFFHNSEELQDFETTFIPGRHFVIGDLSQFNKSMMFKLLKLVEDNPGDIDCYSTSDIKDPILLSRFTDVIKVNLNLPSDHTPDKWDSPDTAHDYTNVVQCMSGCPLPVQLRLPLLNRNLTKLMQLL